MIRGIHHTAISTPNLERALAFYRDVLGFVEVNDFTWPVGSAVIDGIVGLKGSSARTVMLNAGNVMIEFFQYESPPPKLGDPARPVSDHGITHFCLDVRDIEAEYERLVAAGMTFHCPPQDLGEVKATYGRDPDGNVIELQEVLNPDNPMALELG